MNFSKNLKKIRKLKGFTQESFAQKLNIPYKTYINWEQGINEPSFQQLEKIKIIFNCTYDELLNNEKEEINND
ncbi:MAG: helix-turn-helix domain-containing protein [Anaeroplasmataceae bacterium]